MLIEPSEPPHVTWFSVEGYKAFGAAARVELGRITLLLGRNNAGKTALCFAPLYLTHPLRRDAQVPFPTSLQEIDFGSLQSVCFRRQPTGLIGRLGLAGLSGATSVTVGATSLPEQEHTQIVTRLEIEADAGHPRTLANVSWSEARRLLADIEGLDAVAAGIHVLRGVRPAIERYQQYLGYTPESVGPFGQHAPMILAASGEKGLEEVNRWFESMRVRLRIASRGDAFEILVAGPTNEPVNLLDSGTGVAQVLPLVVAARLARAQPSLLCLEQPELHLHPRAHVAVAELLIETLLRRPSARFLVETHSDVLVLRVRREIAAGKLSPRDVRVYFVDEDSAEGSRVKEVPLDERGTPTWWPKDVFGEPQAQYTALRRELVQRRLVP
jgi:hypothetical protein